MQPVKKIEIVTGAVGLDAVLALLEGNGADGYTVIRDATGKGSRGIKAGDELTGVFKNSYILVACPAERAPGLVEAVRPVLARFGGICLVSDVQWVMH